ncbi:uncharacterized protein C7orf31-like isoform X2 [Xenia sp. Carnegie-2017]|uniref:uncharacterized protein C7orf31-like isoform X2 n=1 Tax=Xenia sp. Carnegie-2017 TaxID=2897299 RepID=UPI001F047AB1|nr:uncharacterized protein C7orf31-like isoform X2 [Xenia sp. Carnegie-2017]
MEFLTPYQQTLYKENVCMDPSSRTFHSNIFQGDEIFQSNRTISPSKIDTLEDNHCEERVKTPWGRSRSYAGDGPVYLPTNHRPKGEPPLVLQRTHRHFGSGLFPYPRGHPFHQCYELTSLKKSDLRSNDELIPRPSTTQLHEKQIKIEFPQEHPLSSHMCRHEIFPKSDASDVVDPLSHEEDPQPMRSYVSSKNDTFVVKKIMGNSARREIYTPRMSVSHLKPRAVCQSKTGCLKVDSPYFSRHEIMTEFNRQYPTMIPRLDLNIQKKKQPRWLAHCTSTP